MQIREAVFCDYYKRGGTGLEEQKENSLKKMKRAGQILFCGLTPVFGYVIFETITGNLRGIGGFYLAMNLMCFYMVYLLIICLTGSFSIGAIVGNVLFTVVALGEYFVVEFRAQPILIRDILALGTAATVAGNYSYHITLKVLAAAAVMVTDCILLYRLGLPWPFKGWRKRLASIVGSICVFGAGLWFLYGPVYRATFMYVNLWNPLESYESQGFLLCSFLQIPYMFPDAPEGYRDETCSQILDKSGQMMEEEGLRWSVDTDVVPTNIICIMNESFSDLRVVGEFDTDQEVMPYFDSLKENCLKGNLYMPVFASITANSEYEFLTGNSMAFAPANSIPFQLYMRKPSYGLVSDLKRQGYRAVGMHPYIGSNWNRDKAYDALGFDEFLDQDSFENPSYVRGYISDQCTYEKIIQLTEEKEEGEPLFIFDVTMQNHGGYEEEYEAQIHLTDYQDMPKTEQYLSLIRESDQALEFLIHHFENVEEPTMILMFGDHQPGIEDEFYEALYGCSLDSLEEEDYLRRYITPFVIWTNYDTPSGYVDKLSSQYLSAILMERANLPLTRYQYFLDLMSRRVPVIHMIGYYKEDGTWENWDVWKEKEDYPLFKDYYILEYGNMFGKKHEQWTKTVGE